MALIDCAECGRGISDRAKVCPQCGNPNLDLDDKALVLKRKRFRKLLAAVILTPMGTILIIWGIVWYINRPPRPIPLIDKTAPASVQERVSPPLLLDAPAFPPESK
jgi:hypothetical protein